MRSTGARVAVVTADIVQSTRYSPEDRRQLDRLLRSGFREMEKRFLEAVHTRMAFRITAGDEFQWVMSGVPRAFDALMYLRAIAASGGLKPPVRFRASIGVGGISVATRDNPYEEDGTAFVQSRHGLASMTKARGPVRWTKLITGEPDIDSAADAVLCLLDRMMQSWTAPQWEAIRWSLLGLKREEIAKKLGIAHQNVTKRLHAASWLHFRVGRDFLYRLLESAAPGIRGKKPLHLVRGAKGR